MVYLNNNRQLLLNSEIVEWDIKAANLSIIREFSLLPQSEIDTISQMDKHKRVVHVGLIMKHDKSFAKEFESKFTEVTNQFIKQNELDIEYDVLSVKKDAVFTIAKTIKNPNIGNHIHFVSKNIYHAYMQLSSFEFYFGKNEIDVKGISNDVLRLHQDGMLYFIHEVMKICENCNMDKIEITKFMKDFIEKYKRKELDFDFYREFTQTSKFKCMMYGQEMLLDYIDDSILEALNIEYNYINLILPLVRLVC